MKTAKSYRVEESSAGLLPGLAEQVARMRLNAPMCATMRDAAGIA